MKAEADTASSLQWINDSQLDSLDDTDRYATAWTQALARSALTQAPVNWGGRGRGGRGLARHTWQKSDVIVEGVRLEYVGTENGSCKVLLEDATLKLLTGRLYALIGRNGCGKSTLLRRMAAGKIPGWPPHVSTLYVPQDTATTERKNVAANEVSLIDWLLLRRADQSRQASTATEREIQRLEEEMDQLDVAEEQDQIEEICNAISQLEEDNELALDQPQILKQAQEALTFMNLPKLLWSFPVSKLTAGQRKKASLAVALLSPSDLVILDEPANHLDVQGLLQLRQLITAIQTGPKRSTILLVSHDRDLINEVATDVIVCEQHDLFYSPGNYEDYLVLRQQHDVHQWRQAVALDKKLSAMSTTLDNLKKQPIPKRGGPRKLGKQIASHRKKMERTGLQRNSKGHRVQSQTVGTGIRPGSINSMDASTRRDLSTEKLLQMSLDSIRPPPDQAVQFSFAPIASTWGEPLVFAMDVGFGYDVLDPQAAATVVVTSDEKEQPILTRKEGYLFDSVDLCIQEGGTYCLLGENGCGTTTLLKVLAKTLLPTEGVVKHALNLDVAFLDQVEMDRMLTSSLATMVTTTTSAATPPASNFSRGSAYTFLATKFPKKSEQEIRGELTAFGLGPDQAATDVCFLSGGERTRLALTTLMLAKPQILFLDHPSSNLDMESVEALIHGLAKWNGTIVMVSHDANLVRSLEAECYALVPEEGKLRRVQGGIDGYLKFFGAAARR